MHLERQVDTVVLDVMLFPLIDESLDALILSLSRISRTLIDIDIRVSSCLVVAFSGWKGCRRLLRAQPDPGQLRGEEGFKRAEILEMMAVRSRSGRSTGAYDSNEYLEEPLIFVS